MMYHLKISHFLLLLFLASSHLHSAILYFGDGLTNTSVKSCIEEERHALLSFKQDLYDPSGRLSSWVGLDCCQWEGISCNNRNGHVAKMDLRNLYPDINDHFEEWDPIYTDLDQSAYKHSCLGGKINPSLIRLKHLKYLDLSWNNFEGNHIPKFFGKLKSLRYLNISSASFVGNIPHSLGNLSNLNYLDLSHSNKYPISFERIGSRNFNWLSGLSSLNSLNLGGLNLGSTEVSSLLSMLPSLLELRLANCKMGNVSLPFSVQPSNFTSFLVLDLSYMGIQSPFPSWLFNLTSLRELKFGGNYFIGQFPISKLSMLKSLEYLDLSDMGLTAQIPNFIGNLPKLKFFSLSGNNFSGGASEEFWRSLSNNTMLESLYLSKCELRSQLPASIGNLKNLQHLNISNNYFFGSIPKSIGNLSSLKTLQLSTNHMDGPLPESLGQLSKLVFVALTNNLFSGSIPESIGNLSSLETLKLYSNYMNGSIPESLGQLSKLIHLDLSLNSWEGTLTESHFINLTSLKGIILYNDEDYTPTSLTFNMTYDWVPPFKLHKIALRDCKVGPGFGVWLQSQNELYSLSLHNSSISDSIPEDWFLKLTSQIEYLDLSHNQFRGTIPEKWFLKISSQIDYLDLSYNQFRGRLPLIQLAFPNLPSISLGHNQFEGPFPLWSTNATSCDLQSNLFSGPIPSNIDQLMPNLQELFLSENQLNDTIPPSICNLQELTLLSLRNNQLSGELPRNWSLRSEMYFLDVSSNNLHGSIPASVGALRGLQVLKLNNNNFNSQIPDSLQNCTELISIELGDNNFVGNIPLWIGEFRLFMLQLRFNSFTGHIPVSLCNVINLHILDLSHNNFSGTIPKCFPNLVYLIHNDPNIPPFSEDNDPATLTLKGQVLVYFRTLWLVNLIDLSSNNFQGEIPEEICSLNALGTLNLSMNQLTGKIPSKIGNLSLLETLDLSHNHLSGHIPASFSSLTFLSHLDLSYNNLTGRIPSGNQLQTLDDKSIYEGNPSLCGAPLTAACLEDDMPTRNTSAAEDEDDNGRLWLYISIMLGFGVGFWGVCGTLLLKKTWRYAYFQFFDNIWDRAALEIAIRVACWKRNSG